MTMVKIHTAVLALYLLAGIVTYCKVRRVLIGMPLPPGMTYEQVRKFLPVTVIFWPIVLVGYVLSEAEIMGEPGTNK